MSTTRSSPNQLAPAVDSRVVRARLAVLLMAMLVLIGATVVVAVDRLHAAAAAMDTVYRDRVLCLQQLRLVSEGYVVRIASALAGAREGTLDAPRAIVEIDAAGREIAAQWKAYKATYLVERERRLIAEAEPLMRRADDVVRRLRAALASGDARTLQRMAGRDVPLAFQPVAAVMNRLLDVQADVARQENDRSQAAYRLTVWTMVGLIAVTLAVGAWLAWTVLARHAAAVLVASQAAATGFENFRSVFEISATIMLIAAERDDRVAEVNPAFCEFHGVRREDVIGHTLRELGIGLVEEDRQLAIARYRSEGRVRAMEARTVRRAGEIATILFSAQAIEYQGRPCRLLSAMDITASQEAIRARTLAEAASQAKSEFLAHMSHEIRTPLNAILGLNALLSRTALTAAQAGYLEKSRIAAGSLLQLIDRILDFSKIEAGKLELEDSGFALDDLIEKVTVIVEHRARQKNLQFRTDVAAGVPRRLVGDAQRLAQVLVNLIDNAVKFTHAGSVDVVVTGAALEDRRATLRFSVKDTGIGLNAAQTERLFRPFSQADASTSRRFGGTGLGLAISRQLVELMGGTMGVASVPGEGSEFYFTAALRLQPETAGAASSPDLPGQPAAAVPDALLLPVDDPGTLALLRGRRVLLVEDNEFNQLVASELLGSAAGMRVTVAATGPAALEKLREGAFDAVLMDVQMPEMDGYEAARRIRSDGALAAVPIIAMTAHATARDRQMCLDAGMNDYVTKPFDPQVLFAVLAKWTAEAPRPAWQRSERHAVSFELGLQRCLGRGDLYERITRRFVAERTNTPAAVRAALDAGDPGKAFELVHSLISTAGAIGASVLSEAARELQLAIDAGETLRWPSLVRELEDEHHAVAEELRSYLSGKGGSEDEPVQAVPSAGPGNPDRVGSIGT